MTERAKLHRGRVLVVEDEAYGRESLVAMLGSRGFDVAAASSVAEAAAALARSPVDVVLSDLRMPGADGLELVRRFQADDPELPVLILTGHGTVPPAVSCLRAGASDYILKPAESEALEVAIERAMSTRTLRREVRYLRDALAPSTDAVIGGSDSWRRVTLQARGTRRPLESTDSTEKRRLANLAPARPL